jgi:hypothetical protein
MRHGIERIARLVCVTLGTIVITCGASASAQSPFNIPICDTSLDATLASARVAGMSAAVFGGGKVLCVTQAGVQNVGNQIPMSSQTVLPWASVVSITLICLSKRFFLCVHT